MSHRPLDLSDSVYNRTLIDAFNSTSLNDSPLASLPKYRWRVTPGHIKGSTDPTRRMISSYNLCSNLATLSDSVETAAYHEVAKVIVEMNYRVDRFHLEQGTLDLPVATDSRTQTGESSLWIGAGAGRAEGVVTYCKIIVKEIIEKMFGVMISISEHTTALDMEVTSLVHFVGLQEDVVGALHCFRLLMIHLDHRTLLCDSDADFIAIAHSFAILEVHSLKKITADIPSVSFDQILHLRRHRIEIADFVDHHRETILFELHDPADILQQAEIKATLVARAIPEPSILSAEDASLRLWDPRFDRLGPAAWLGRMPQELVNGVLQDVARAKTEIGVKLDGTLVAGVKAEVLHLLDNNGEGIYGFVQGTGDIDIACLTVSIEFARSASLWLGSPQLVDTFRLVLLQCVFARADLYCITPEFIKILYSNEARVFFRRYDAQLNLLCSPTVAAQAAIRLEAVADYHRKENTREGLGRVDSAYRPIIVSIVNNPGPGTNHGKGVTGALANYNGLIVSSKSGNPGVCGWQTRTNKSGTLSPASLEDATTLIIPLDSVTARRALAAVDDQFTALQQSGSIWRNSDELLTVRAIDAEAEVASAAAWKARLAVDKIVGTSIGVDFALSRAPLLALSKRELPDVTEDGIVAAEIDEGSIVVCITCLLVATGRKSMPERPSHWNTILNARFNHPRPIPSCCHTKPAIGSDGAYFSAAQLGSMPNGIKDLLKIIELTTVYGTIDSNPVPLRGMLFGWYASVEDDLVGWPAIQSSMHAYVAQLTIQMQQLSFVITDHPQYEYFMYLASKKNKKFRFVFPSNVYNNLEAQLTAGQLNLVAQMLYKGVDETENNRPLLDLSEVEAEHEDMDVEVINVHKRMRLEADDAYRAGEVDEES